MELSWISKTRIVLAFAIGAMLVGFLPWSRVEPANNGVFALLSNNITSTDLIICGLLSLAAGFVASAICTPYGFQIGVIAVPAGMSVWAYKSAAVSTLFQAVPAAGSRAAVYASLRFEAFIWLALMLLGVIGAYAADKLFRRNSLDLPDKFDPTVKLEPMIAIAVAFVSTIIAGIFLLNILATDVGYPDKQFGFVFGQPATLQIIFGVVVTFLICSFCAKLYLGVHYIWPVIATAFVSVVSMIVFTKTPALGYMSASWAPVFFSKTVISILPIQMIAFGSIGCVWGYWLAARYKFWREFEA
ncbi:MAG: hypothetical protein A2Y12_07670 [Planctomycetes bacterium GWF2_42_9]|nr:MAG: hypothetical protein A2Y12_07670 [Planctomycetes bacterium GWF2_42_9]HAL44794.1 hypothetical protein [Phycisphaerales bacterium]